MFVNPNLGKLDYDEVIQEITKFVLDKKESSYELVVGTDSGRKNSEHVFVSSVSIYRVGNGGRIFTKKNRGEGSESIRQRLIVETKKSIKLAKRLKETFSSMDFIDEFNLFKVHVDIGTDGMFGPGMEETLKGMVKQEGFKPAVKPESYGASNIADRFV